MSADGGTRTSLLDLAQDLAQRHGYNGFSYHQLARRLGLTTASIHYHFPSKEDLVSEVMVAVGLQLQQAMKLVRKIFPYRDKCAPNSGKRCFNAQIGLCPGVCSGETSKEESWVALHESEAAP